MSQRHPLKDGSYCIPGPFQLPPYEVAEIWRRTPDEGEMKVPPGFTEQHETVFHCGATHYRMTTWPR